MPKRNPFILCFVSVKHPTRVSLCCVETLHLWKWGALLNPDLLMVYYPGHRLSKLLPAAVRSSFGPCSGRWHLQLPWEEVRLSFSTLCEPLGVELTKEPGCAGRLAAISSGELRERDSSKSMSAVGIYQSLTLPIDSLGLRYSFHIQMGGINCLKHWMSLVSELTLIRLELPVVYLLRQLCFLLPLQGTEVRSPGWVTQDPMCPAAWPNTYK